MNKNLFFEIVLRSVCVKKIRSYRIYKCYVKGGFYYKCCNKSKWLFCCYSYSLACTFAHNEYLLSYLRSSYE